MKNYQIGELVLYDKQEWFDDYTDVKYQRCLCTVRYRHVTPMLDVYTLTHGSWQYEGVMPDHIKPVSTLYKLLYL